MITKDVAKEEVRCVALGDDADVEEVQVEERQPQTAEEKIVSLDQRVSFLTSSLDNLFTMVKDLANKADTDKNKIIGAVIEKKKKENRVEIPEGTVLTGTTKGLNYFMHIKDGGFYVGITRYESLSAAAEGVSGVRRSGWTFWKLPDGKNVKESFNKG
ncbi:hypothetical protein LCGC14_0759970 [marine sediment metagenome]|uniref:RAMA domain-containing protein n=1 Tax=marine sediment metagenome TaxID=412755 RepID=A0A0F9SLP7_9ZZZZ